MNDEMLRQIGLFAGLVIRLLGPAAYVWYHSDDFKWNHKYTKQFLRALALAFIGMAFGYTGPDPLLTGQMLFWSSVKDGILLEEAINQFRKLETLRTDKIVAEKIKEMKING